MLKGLDPLLYPALLHTLCAMGHGDEIALVDANFTAASLAGARPLLRLDGVPLARACAAVLSVFPLDTAVAQPVAYMQVCELPTGAVSPMQESVLDLVARVGATSRAACAPVERFAFYARTREAFAILQTGEQEPYGNLILRKAVIAPGGLSGEHTAYAG